MFARRFPSIASLMIVSVGLGLPTVWCQTTNRPSDSRADGESPGGFSIGGLKSILEDSVSPAFGAAIIIIITVIVSGSAYLCLLKYICGGCCRPMQVEPSAGGSVPNKVEEQV